MLASPAGWSLRIVNRAICTLFLHSRLPQDWRILTSSAPITAERPLPLSKRIRNARCRQCLWGREGDRSKRHWHATWAAWEWRQRKSLECSYVYTNKHHSPDRGPRLEGRSLWYWAKGVRPNLGLYKWGVGTLTRGLPTLLLHCVLKAWDPQCAFETEQAKVIKATSQVTMTKSLLFWKG